MIKINHIMRNPILGKGSLLGGFILFSFLVLFLLLSGLFAQEEGKTYWVSGATRDELFEGVVERVISPEEYVVGPGDEVE